jgi:hypothetical protein
VLRPRWNLSSRARELSSGDALVLSIPKSGRTWLRTFINAYFCRKTGREFSLEQTDRHAPGIPRIVYSHDRFENRTKGSNWDRLRGKYLVPRAQTRRGPIILLARDPRDTLVSYFVQLTRRNPATPRAIQQMPADKLLRHPRFGIAAMVTVMNAWLAGFGGRSDFHLMRYENLRADPKQHFGLLLRDLGETVINQGAFQHALEFSSFENMQRLEASGAFDNKILQPRDRQDQESFKVRRGTVGGFAEYLSPSDQEFAAQICRRLNPAFGYRV